MRHLEVAFGEIPGEEALGPSMSLGLWSRLFSGTSLGFAPNRKAQHSIRVLSHFSFISSLYYYNYPKNVILINEVTFEYMDTCLVIKKWAKGALIAHNHPQRYIEAFLLSGLFPVISVGFYKEMVLCCGILGLMTLAAQV